MTYSAVTVMTALVHGGSDMDCDTTPVEAPATTRFDAFSPAAALAGSAYALTRYVGPVLPGNVTFVPENPKTRKYDAGFVGTVPV